MDTPNTVITIGRQMGSGGRMVGRILAERLGYGYYDRELLDEAARSSGVDPEFFERNDERRPSLFTSAIPFNMGFSAHSFFAAGSTISADAIQRAQCSLIASLPEKGPCVIVGRSADFVLRDHPRLVSVFISASIDERVKRILLREPSWTPEKARAFALRADKLRAAYYNFYTDRTWGHASTYHLCIDSSSIPLDKVADIITRYVDCRFA